MIVDTSTGRELTVATRSALGLTGARSAEPLTWRSNSASVAIANVPHSEAGIWRMTALFANGTTHAYGGGGSFLGVSPGGRWITSVEDELDFWVTDGTGCRLVETVRIRSLDDDQLVATLALGGYVLRSGLRWSPDGTAMLAEFRQLPDPGGACSERWQELRDAPAIWLLANTGTDVVSRIDNPVVVRRSWFPQPRVAIVCDAVETAIGSFRDFGCRDSDGRFVSGNLTYGGEMIPTVDLDRVLGVIELSDE